MASWSTLGEHRPKWIAPNSSPDHRFASVTGGSRALDGERLIA
jgi:hypothetical protein